MPSSIQESIERARAQRVKESLLNIITAEETLDNPNIKDRKAINEALDILIKQYVATPTTPSEIDRKISNGSQLSQYLEQKGPKDATNEQRIISINSDIVKYGESIKASSQTKRMEAAVTLYNHSKKDPEKLKKCGMDIANMLATLPKEQDLGPLKKILNNSDLKKSMSASLQSHNIKKEDHKNSALGSFMETAIRGEKERGFFSKIGDKLMNRTPATTSPHSTTQKEHTVDPQESAPRMKR